jgi:hypothetical protein
MKEQEIRQKYKMPPLEGPRGMGHDDDCPECSAVRSNGKKSVNFVKDHANDPKQKTYRDPPSNLNHGNECPYCNEAVLNTIGRNNHFDIGGNEGK